MDGRRNGVSSWKWEQRVTKFVWKCRRCSCVDLRITAFLIRKLRHLRLGRWSLFTCRVKFCTRNPQTNGVDARKALGVIPLLLTRKILRNWREMWRFLFGRLIAISRMVTSRILWYDVSFDHKRIRTARTDKKLNINQPDVTCVKKDISQIFLQIDLNVETPLIYL